MTEGDGLPPLREVIAATGLSERKSLGQNFIRDLNLTRHIARLAGPLNGKTVLEIGPGPGGLTRALLREGADKVIVVEKDERCVSALQEIREVYKDRLEIIIGDALKIDHRSLLTAGSLIVANLPYNIATPLLLKWLKMRPWPPLYERMVLMFQHEVALRLVSERGCKSYGRLAVIAQWATALKIALNLPPEAFTPRPQVTSSVVVFEPHKTLNPPCEVAHLERVTRAAFGQRRKMLRVSLKQIFAHPEEVLERTGIKPTGRAEDLTVEDFCRLALALKEENCSRVRTH